MAVAEQVRPRVTVVEPARTQHRFVSWLRRRGIRNAALIGGLTIFAVWTLFPFAWILATSIKPSRDVFVTVSILPKHVTFEHYRYVLESDDFRTYFRNSLTVASMTTAIAMAIAILSAYALPRLSFRGRGFVARATIVTYLIPASLLFIPLFQIANQLR